MGGGTERSKLRVSLWENLALVRAGWRPLINAEPQMEVSGEAGDGRTVCLQVPELQPDVVVMDVSMPQMNGAQATAKLKQACPNVKVLALTVHEDKGYLRLLLEAGASGYMLKRAAGGELIHRIPTAGA